MSKVTMPEPFGWLSDSLMNGGLAFSKTDPHTNGTFITNSTCAVYRDHQMNRYANAKVREALEWRPIETAPRDGTWVRLWREPETVGIASPEIIAVWHQFDDSDDGPIWMWPTEIYDPYTDRGRTRAMDEIESGDFYEDDSFTHWMPLPSPPSPPA